MTCFFQHCEVIWPRPITSALNWYEKCWPTERQIAEGTIPALSSSSNDSSEDIPDGEDLEQGNINEAQLKLKYHFKDNTDFYADFIENKMCMESLNGLSVYGSPYFPEMSVHHLQHSVCQLTGYKQAPRGTAFLATVPHLAGVALISSGSNFQSILFSLRNIKKPCQGHVLMNMFGRVHLIFNNSASGTDLRYFDLSCKLPDNLHDVL